MPDLPLGADGAGDAVGSASLLFAAPLLRSVESGEDMVEGRSKLN